MLKINYSALRLFPVADSRNCKFSYDDGFSGVAFSSAATPVPFEVNPTLGLLLVGGLFGSNRLYRKHKRKKI